MNIQDIIEIYKKPFNEIYRSNRENMSKILGIEMTHVQGVRNAMKNHIKDIHSGKFDYFENNQNLVSILVQSEDNPLKIVKSRETKEESNLLSLAVPRWEFTYILMYKLTYNQGGK